MPRTVVKRPDSTGYAVWDCKLTDDEMKRLATGTHPLEIAKGWLVYWVEGPGAIALWHRWQAKQTEPITHKHVLGDLPNG